MRGRQRDHGAHAAGVGHGPLQRLHPAHRSASDREQPVDAEAVEQGALHLDHVGDRHDGKGGAPGPARGRVDRGRPRRPVAAAERVRADHAVAGRIEGLARADHHIPPPGLRCAGVVARRVGPAGQRVADQDDVVARRRHRAVALERNRDRRQAGAALQRQAVLEDRRELGLDRAEAAWGAAHDTTSTTANPTADSLWHSRGTRTGVAIGLMPTPPDRSWTAGCRQPPTAPMAARRWRASMPDRRTARGASPWRAPRGHPARQRPGARLRAAG